MAKRKPRSDRNHLIYVVENVLTNQRYIGLTVVINGNAQKTLAGRFKRHVHRALIERNAELVEERHHAHRWHDRYEAGQWQALSNQMQAFQSQLATTTQGMVNFGTMAGVGQSSTANNVR